MHDPEKWTPVFGKDHAQTKRLERMMTRKQIIPLWRSTLKFAHPEQPVERYSLLLEKFQRALVAVDHR